MLPTLDERDNLEALLPALLALPSVGEVWVVDDGSTDGTCELVRRMMQEEPRLHLLERRGRPCLTDAIREGIEACTSEHVAWMDADGAMQPADLERLHDALIASGADLAVGSRFTPDGRIKGQAGDGWIERWRALTQLGDTADPWFGVLLSWGLNGVVLPLLLGRPTHDYTSGFAVARRAVILELGMRGDHGEYFIDLWVSAERAGYRIVEVGYAIQPRRHGASKTAESALGYLWRGRRYVSTAWALRRGSRGR
ncbi:MAG: glycosyltransferase [Sandaracinaceae bacterium]